MIQTITVLGGGKNGSPDLVKSIELKMGVPKRIEGGISGPRTRGALCHCTLARA
jgi:hypothetical protein